MRHPPDSVIDPSEQLGPAVILLSCVKIVLSSESISQYSSLKDLKADVFSAVLRNALETSVFRCFNITFADNSCQLLVIDIIFFLGLLAPHFFYG